MLYRLQSLFSVKRDKMTVTKTSRRDGIQVSLTTFPQPRKPMLQLEM
jgi:hypothetical protein